MLFKAGDTIQQTMGAGNLGKVESATDTYLITWYRYGRYIGTGNYTERELERMFNPRRVCPINQETKE